MTDTLIEDGAAALDRILAVDAKKRGFLQILVFVVALSAGVSALVGLGRVIVNAINSDAAGSFMMHGYILDSSGQPVKRCRVVLQGTLRAGGPGTREAMTDDLGFFVFNSMDLFDPAGDTRLQLSKDGYEPRDLRIDEFEPHFHFTEIMLPQIPQPQPKTSRQ